MNKLIKMMTVAPLTASMALCLMAMDGNASVDEKSPWGGSQSHGLVIHGDLHLYPGGRIEGPQGPMNDAGTLTPNGSVYLTGDHKIYLHTSDGLPTVVGVLNTVNDIVDRKPIKDKARRERSPEEETARGNFQEQILDRAMEALDKGEGFGDILATVKDPGVRNALLEYVSSLPIQPKSLLSFKEKSQAGAKQAGISDYYNRLTLRDVFRYIEGDRSALMGAEHLSDPDEYIRQDRLEADILKQSQMMQRIFGDAQKNNGCDESQKSTEKMDRHIDHGLVELVQRVTPIYNAFMFARHFMEPLRITGEFIGNGETLRTVRMLMPEQTVMHKKHHEMEQQSHADIAIRNGVGGQTSAVELRAAMNSGSPMTAGLDSRIVEVRTPGTELATAGETTTVVAMPEYWRKALAVDSKKLKPLVLQGPKTYKPMPIHARLLPLTPIAFTGHVVPLIDWSYVAIADRFLKPHERDLDKMRKRLAGPQDGIVVDFMRMMALLEKADVHIGTPKMLPGGPLSLIKSPQDRDPLAFVLAAARPQTQVVIPNQFFLPPVDVIVDNGILKLEKGPFVAHNFVGISPFASEFEAKIIGKIQKPHCPTSKPADDDEQEDATPSDDAASGQTGCENCPCKK